MWSWNLRLSDIGTRVNEDKFIPARTPPTILLDEEEKKAKTIFLRSSVFRRLSYELDSAALSSHGNNKQAAEKMFSLSVSISFVVEKCAIRNQQLCRSKKEEKNELLNKFSRW